MHVVHVVRKRVDTKGLLSYSFADTDICISYIYNMYQSLSIIINPCQSTASKSHWRLRPPGPMLVRRVRDQRGQLHLETPLVAKEAVRHDVCRRGDLRQRQDGVFLLANSYFGFWHKILISMLPNKNLRIGIPEIQQVYLWLGGWVWVGMGEGKETMQHKTTRVWCFRSITIWEPSFPVCTKWIFAVGCNGNSLFCNTLARQWTHATT